ncbi:MAG: LamG-like jellyroll fold domain-containing protein [Cyclobacteriaceae bacterium]
MKNLINFFCCLATTIWISNNARSQGSGVNYNYFEKDCSGINQLSDFDNEVPVASGITTQMNLSPAQRADCFGLEFTGVIFISSTETYTFYTTSDDGSKLWINDQLLVNNDGLHGNVTVSGSVSLTEGYHSLRVTHFEKTGGESLSVEYSGNSISRQVIPANVLFQNFPPTTVLDYQIAGQDGNSNIQSFTKTIELFYPYDLDRSNLIATFTLENGLTASVNSVNQISGTTSNDFTNPVTYVFNPGNEIWTVNVNQSPPASAFKTFQLPGQIGAAEIDSVAKTIDVTFPNGLDVSNLAASFSLETILTASVGGVNQVSGTTTNNFTNPVSYLINPRGETWTVTATHLPPPEPTAPVDPIISSGLYTYYPFNGDGYDHSGNDRHVIIDGPTPMNNRFGEPNSSFYFDGNDEIFVDLNYTLLYDNSISFWFKTTGTNQNLLKFSHSNSSSYYMYLDLNGSKIRFSRNGASGYIVESNSSGLNDGNWHHVVITNDNYNNDNHIRFYIDGAYDNYGTMDVYPASSMDMEIGDGILSDLVGSIDDFRFYDRQLTIEEVESLFYENTPTPSSPDPIVSNGLLAFYPFNMSARDESGNGKNSFYQGSTKSSDRHNIPNSAVAFDGSNDEIFIDLNHNLRLGSTISLWFKTTQTNQSLLKFPHTASSTYYTYLDLNGSRIRFTRDGDSGHILESNISGLNDGNWHHVTITNEYSNSDNHFKIFVDGSFDNMGSFDLYSSSSDIEMGDGKLSDFDGELDDLRIYDRHLTTQEVEALYYENMEAPSPVDPVVSSGLLTFLPFEGNGNDQSGNGKDGLLQDVTLTADRLNKPNTAYSFDGSNDEIFVNLNYNLRLSHSISLWFRTNNANQSLIKFPHGNSSSYFHYLDLSGSKVRFSRDADSGKIVESNVSGLNDANWHHVTITNDYYDNDNHIRIYIDGAYDQYGEFDLYSSTSGMEIGDGLLSDLNGDIDDVRFYDRKLSSHEVESLYYEYQEMPSAPDTVISSGLHVFYPFNANAHDYSGNGKDAIPIDVNAIMDRFGVPNSAYSFDGTDDKIEVPLNHGIKSNIGFSFWFKTTSADASLLKFKNSSSSSYYSYLDLSGSKVRFRYRTGSGSEIISPNGGYNDDQWHHVVISNAYISSWESGLKMYIDGIYVANTNFSNINGNSHTLVIGRGSYSDYEGEFDDFRFYNRPIESLEVLELYNEGTDDYKAVGSNFLSFSIPNEHDQAIISEVNSTIELFVNSQSDITALIPDFTCFAGSLVEVAGQTQESGVTTQNFSSPITYSVTSSHGITKHWIVSVNQLNGGSDMLTFSFPGMINEVDIDHENNEINVRGSFHEEFTNLIPAFSTSHNAIVSIDGAPQISGESSNDYSTPLIYTIVSEDESSTTNWTVNVEQIEFGTTNWRVDKMRSVYTQDYVGIGKDSAEFNLDIEGIVNADSLIVDGVPYVSFNGASIAGNGLSWVNNKLAITDGTGIEWDETSNEIRVDGESLAGTGLQWDGEHLMTDVNGVNYWKEDNLGKVNYTGNVGIGVVDPSEALEVAGTIYTTKIKVDVNAGQTPDYVFEDDYDLMPLSEIQEYIEANKHLPEVPSASEMEANGMNLNDMNLLLLKKVEELTLHQIDLLDQINLLKKELLQLKSEVQTDQN